MTTMTTAFEYRDLQRRATGQKLRPRDQCKEGYGRVGREICSSFKQGSSKERQIFHGSAHRAGSRITRSTPQTVADARPASSGRGEIDLGDAGPTTHRKGSDHFADSRAADLRLRVLFCRA